MSMKGKNNKKNTQQQMNDSQQPQSPRQQQKKKQSTKKRSSRSNQARNNRRGGNNNNRGGNNNNRGNHHGSVLPVPSSKAKRNRQRGKLENEIKKHFEQDSYQIKREKIKDLTNGAPFDAFNSFYSTATEDEIFNNLTMSLKSQKDIDVETHETDYKLRGRKFIFNESCEWQIEMFSTTSTHPTHPNHILVEFQRRNGNGLVFQQFVSSVMTDLKQAKIIAFTKHIDNYPCYLSPKPIGSRYTNHNHWTLNHDNNNTQNDDEWEEKENHDNGHRHRHHRSNNNVILNDDNDDFRDNNDIDIDSKTLEILVTALFNGKNREMCRTASAYLANNIKNNKNLVNEIINLEPHILTKVSDLLLKCVDAQIVRCIGFTLCYMLEQSNQLKNQAIQLNMKTVCKKVYKRWTQPVESRYGPKFIPSLQVAQRMISCIAVLE